MNTRNKHAPVPLSAQPAQAEPTQYLTFMLGLEMFAIGIPTIKEIIEYQQVTVVPMMAPSVRGVINLRGAVVPVVDVSARFGMRSTEVTKRTCIVVVEIEHEGEHQDVGLIVDTVNHVLDIPEGEIEPPPAFGAKIRTDFIQGMCKVDSKFVILLDLSHLLSIDELSALAETGPNGQESPQTTAG